MDPIVGRLTLDGLEAGCDSHPVDLIHLRPYLEDILGHRWVADSVAELQRWVWQESDPLFVKYYLDRPLNTNPLIAALLAAQYWEEDAPHELGASVPYGVQRLHQIVSAISMAEVHAGAVLNGGGVKHRRDRLRSAEGVWGFIHECEMFTTFIRMGIPAIPSFLRPGTPVDIHIELGGRLIPVQCKSKEPGAGRSFKEDISTRLLAAIARDLHRSGRRLAITIRPASNLFADDIPILRLAARRLPNRTRGEVLEVSGARLFALHARPIDALISNESAVQFLEQFGFHVGLTVAEPMSQPGMNRVQAVAGILAEPNENPAPAFLTALSRAARGLDNGPAGFAAVHYFSAHPFEDDCPAWMNEPFNKQFKRHKALAAVIVSTEPHVLAPGKLKAMRSRWTYRADGLPDGFPVVRGTAPLAA